MFGAILVFVVAVALVATYMFTVNRLLRTDEHWSESNQVKPATKTTATGHYGVIASPAHA